MSMMRTLAKVAIGVAVAKGASHMMKNAGGAGGLGGLLGGMNTSSAGGAGLDDMLGGLLGGGAGGAGGLGGLLDGLAGGGARGGAGGLQDLIGGLAGAGGAGALLGGLAQQMGQRPQTANAGFGQVLNSAFDTNPEPEIAPSADQEVAAALMLSAMIQAAKSDGKLDDEEQEKLMGKLGGDIDAEEAAFLREQMQAPIDVDALVQQTPNGMASQVYAMSLLAIDLDNQAEAQYLHSLAQAYGLEPTAVNNIHEQLGVPSLYT